MRKGLDIQRSHHTVEVLINLDQMKLGNLQAVVVGQRQRSFEEHYLLRQSSIITITVLDTIHCPIL
jgi:hypothetical protein